jgi:hypothetical protein
MRRFRIVALGTGVTLAAGIAAAIAGTPFGGDDEGTIPSDAPQGPVTRCEILVAKASGKLFASIWKCHAGRTTGKIADDTAEDACESAAITKFKGTKTAGCAGCTDLSLIGTSLEAGIDSNGLPGVDRSTLGLSALVYSDQAGTPFGDDEFFSFIPPDAPNGPETRCENSVGQAVGKFFGSITKCHTSRVRGRFTDETGEEGCESAAKAKSFAEVGCSRPLGVIAAIADTVEAYADHGPQPFYGITGVNSLIWCGSPSGAFLQ